MSEYVDTQLINCNRLASVESRSKNDSNPAIFTNTLEQSVKLDVGDKVSVERAFINELGAGNPQTIEFKGESRGSNPVSTYSKVVYDNFYRKMDNIYDPKYRLGYYRSITTTEESGEEVELRDNLAPLVLGYYITANEYPNYIQQPRRFISAEDTRGLVGRDFPNQYSNRDSFGAGSVRFPINEECIMFEDWTRKISAEAIGYMYKQKVDNTRYTLYIKDKIAYSDLSDTGGTRIDVNQFPKKYHNGIIQEATYIRYRERLDINVDKGFNTPSAVASQITQQLTETKNEDIFQNYDRSSNVRSITKTIETNTYKPINAQNIYNVNQETLAAYTALDIPTSPAFITQDAIDYIATFGYIAVKRPEIFDQGRRMAKLLSTIEAQPILRTNTGAVRLGNFSDGEEGFQTVGDRPIANAQTTNEDSTITINIIYNEENLKIIRDFFDSQALYPEIWDKLNETELYGAAKLGILTLPTIENSRFFHMNLLTTDPLAAPRSETFGTDMYVDKAAPNNTIAQMTNPVFFNYDDSLRDIFISPTAHNGTLADGLSMGFALPTRIAQYNAAGVRQEDIFYITLVNRGVGGIGRSFFKEQTSPVDPNFRSIEEGRRIGYDHHASAYSTAIITPYSGYTNCDIGVAANFQNAAGANIPDTHTFPATNNFIRSMTNGDLVTDLNPYQTMTYIGANNPEIRYNNETNRFELSRFHTSNNIGNKRNANNQATTVNSATQYPAQSRGERAIAPPSINAQAGDTVYKINPRPTQFGFSPTFRPYNRENQAYRTNVFPKTPKDVFENFTAEGGNTQKYNGFNAAIEPYTVFDSHGGIYIDNWGFDRDNWTDSLWDILGFDYNATNAPPTNKNVLTKRVDNENSDLLYRPTTNAEVVQTDTKNYITNEYGAVMYYTSLPYPNCVISYTARGGGNFIWTLAGDDTDTDRFNPVKSVPLELWSEVDVLTTSTTITATNIQKAVLRPYYTVRSNILEGYTAIGGNPTGSNLPIVSIVDKYSGASDYFLGNPSDLQFTITKPTMISNITTSIHDSDGRYANVNLTSAVIYKIQKMKRTPTGIIDDIMEEEQEEAKKNKKTKK